MKPSMWLWRTATVCFTSGLLVFATPTLAGVAAVSVGDLSFSWGHVLMLIAAAALYGDMRTNIARDREEARLDRTRAVTERNEMRQEFREGIHELRAEIKQLWDRRG